MRIAIALSVAILILFGWRELHFSNKTKKLNKELAVRDAKILALENSYSQSDTVTLIVRDTFTIPIPYPVTSVDTIRDTITGEPTEVITTYQDSIPAEDVTLLYALKTTGKLKDLALSYRMRKQTITTEHIVYIDKPVEIDKTPRFNMHAGLSEGIQVHALQAELAATYKGFGISGAHDLTNNTQRVGIFFRLK